jgi:hypothetical protein
VSPLSDQQIRFCDEYLVDFNGKRAAIAAGYAKKGAAASASRLLTYVNVQAYLAKKKEKIATKLELSQERTLLEIARVALFDPRNLFDDEGKLINIKELDPDTAAVISSIEVDEDISTDEDDDLGLDLDEEDEADPVAPKGPKTPKGPKVTGTVTKKVKLWSKMQALGLLSDYYGIKKPAPAPPVNLNFNSLSTEDLKALQALKQKAKG